MRAGSVLQPVPSHNGQTATCALINIRILLLSCTNSIFKTLHPHPCFPQVRNDAYLCTTCEAARGPVESRGKRSPLDFQPPGSSATPHSCSCRLKPAPPAPIRDLGV